MRRQREKSGGRGDRRRSHDEEKMERSQEEVKQVS
jgi:hypothetical protein